jgi:ubiquinone/menaquinone biosynthesis C-methylase UbiE
MTSSPTPDFGRRATTYDVLRPADANWWDRFDALVREGDLRGQRVLDVGCGTGTLAAALAERGQARVWGVEPSAEMLEVARAKAPRAVGFKQARAEELPFRDGWFDRVTMSLVAHLVDRPVAFAEARRVLAPKGRLVVLTFEEQHFDIDWLGAYFPSIQELARARFPAHAQLEQELRAAGFAEVRDVRIAQTAEIGREEALARIRGRHVSTFDLLSAEELAEGTVRAERELPARLRYELRHLIVVAEN